MMLLALTVVCLHAVNCYASKRFLDELPRFSLIEPEFSVSKIKERLASMPLHHIEGIWQFTGQGFTVAIERDGAESGNYTSDSEGYRIYLIQAPNRALRPGTVIGHVSRSASEGVYDARIYTKSIGSRMSAPKGFTVKLDAGDSRMVFEPKKSALSVNLWRLLPYMWRYSVRQNHNSAPAEGCVRVFPVPDLPFEPVYL